MVVPAGEDPAARGPVETGGPILRPEPTDAGASETEGWWPQPAADDEPFNSPRRWAGRLAFPLLAVAVLLAWQGVRVSEEAPSALPRWAWWTLAGLSAVAGLVLVRLRHLPRRGGPAGGV